MMFRPVISIVEFARTPVDAKLLLTFPVPQPIETHVHRFGAFWRDFAIHDATRHGIVGLEWGGRLLVSEFFQYNSNEDGLACHDV